jgi:nucleotide-binding universal stress UspA family protein
VIVQRDGPRPLSGIRTVLVPLDGSPISVPGLGAGVDLANATGAHLVVLRVLEPIPSWMYDAPSASRIDPSWDAAALAGAERYVEDLGGQLCEAGVSASDKVVIGEVPSAIVEVAENMKADLILMSTHAQRGAARIPVGSTTDAVVRLANAPTRCPTRRGKRVSTGRCQCGLCAGGGPSPR